MNKENIFAYQTKITKKNAEKAKATFICVMVTGLSGSGKSTLANALDDYLFKKGKKSYILLMEIILDSGLNNDLDFSDSGRHENIRRIGEAAKLFVDAGLIVITAFISPFKKERQLQDLLEKTNLLKFILTAH